MEINTVRSVWSLIFSHLRSLTSLKHFMDSVDNDPQCIRECVVHYFVLFAVYNGSEQHLTRRGPSRQPDKDLGIHSSQLLQSAKFSSVGLL